MCPVWILYALSVNSAAFCQAMECCMLDIVYLVGGSLFFAATVLYATACNRL